MKNYQKYIALISLSILLAACGSSGGKGGNDQSSQPKKEINKPVALATSKPNQNTENSSKPVLKEQEKPMDKVENQPSTNENKVLQPAIDQANDKKVDVPSEINKAVETWFAGGGSAYSKDEVRVYKIIENEQNRYDDDPNIKEVKPEFIKLSVGTNYDTGDYAIKLLDENLYYGYYRYSEDMKRADIKYIYSFKESAENKGNLSGLNATYEGEFLYTLKSNPDLATRSKVYLKYENGEAKGKAISVQVAPGEEGRKLFDINSDTNNIRTLIFNPATKELDNSIHNETVVVRKNSPDRIAIDTHFINGQDGKENKHLIGKGGNDKYWGILGVGKVE